MARKSDRPTPEVSAVERMGDFQPQRGHKTSPAERAEAGLLPTGEQLFSALSDAEQAKAIGEEPARLVRDGAAALSDFIQHQEREAFPQQFITQKPTQEVATTDDDSGHDSR